MWHSHTVEYHSSTKGMKHWDMKNMDEFLKHQKKPITRDHILHVFVYMKCTEQAKSIETQSTVVA